MNRSHLWKALFVVFVVIWSLSEILPPGPRNLIVKFDEMASNVDPRFTNIVARAFELEAAAPDRAYQNLLLAIGTNDIRPYFPTNFVPLAASRNLTNATRAILNRVQREAAGQFRLGLDLRGGTEFVLEMDLSGRTNELLNTGANAYLVDQAIEVLRKRVDAFGVAEPIIQPAGENRIVVQLPGLEQSAKESAREQIQRAAYLEFRLVDPDNDEHLRSGLIPPGYVMLPMRARNRDGVDIAASIIVKRQAERGLGGKSIQSARVARNPVIGSPEIDFTLTSEATPLFAEVTRNNIGQRLAIVLDGEVISAPNINSAIVTGAGQITGSFTEREAFELATALENPLEAPLIIVEENGVDPSLGADSIRSGIRASVIAILAVAGFMLGYYLLAGLVANVALMLNILVLLGVMCSLDVTFTLPGIAGIVLTVGMAVDANVLIFERIREEQLTGKSVRGALAAGYGKAFGTILDSNLTTLISSVLLILFGTGPVKGFGVALTVGLCISMFTALVVTRLIFDFLLAKTPLLRGGIRMLRLVGRTHIDFMKLAKPAFVASWVLIVAGLGYGIFGRGENLLGVEFRGGDRITLQFSQKVPVDQIRAEVARLNRGDATIGYSRGAAGSATGDETLRISAAEGTSALIEEQLARAFPEAGFKRIELQKIGPTVGQEIQKSAVIAGLLSLFGILVYVAFRYEFSFAVGAVLAVVHDVLMTVAIYSLTGLGNSLTGGWIEARQFNATFIAALLTIVGFSINDTIVIFDRIREDLRLGIPGSFRDLLNRALNQTLSRTIITSGTVFLSTLALYLFGGGSVNDFAFAFLVGILAGTYSSVYIASTLVLWWNKGKRPALAAGVPTAAVAPEPARSAA
ncbi:MAG: protein translocase subunit SecD [Verrucomicrobiae bacterium]|nr:protein translocase subunit SecD [Verrucomicrobiae bacterium]